jgi:hypothetical protein
MHYQRVLATGEAGPVESHKPTYGAMKGLKCSVDGCEDPATLKLMCRFHYDRVRLSGSVGPAHRLRNERPPEARNYTPGELHRYYKYGLTPEAFAEMLANQGGRCYICRTDAPNGKGWSVDHCHETNAVRFIACNPCNAAFGLIKEDPDVAKRMWEVAVESRARKGAEVRLTDLVEWAVSAHGDLVRKILSETEEP